MNPLAFLQWHENALKRRRPAPAELNDTERLDWLGEYCEQSLYVAPNLNSIGHFILYDSLGQRTIAANFRDAIDRAHDKWKEVNGE